MLIAILTVLISFAVLTWSADRFVFAASATARLFRVSPLVIGVTIVGFGTSAPELLISALAASQGNAAMSVGNALGSNITNVALILGITALVTPLAVASNVLRRELPVLLGCVLLAGVLLWDLSLDLFDGVLLLSVLAGVLCWFASRARHAPADDALAVEMTAELRDAVPPGTAIGWLIGSLALLLVSARALVWGAVHIAQSLGISELVIGLTVLAIGTSLPELAASVASALKQEHDIALGNVIGSNTFNILGVLAMPGLFRAGALPAAALHRDLLIVLLLTVALLVMAMGWRGRPGRINRYEGAVLLAAFVAYQIYLLNDG